MKKTLVVLLSLAGVAMAGAEISYLTLDNAYTIVGGDDSLVSSVETVLSGSTTYLNLNQLAHGNIAPGATQGTTALNQTLTLENMLISGGDLSVTGDQKLILTSIQVVSRPNTNNRPTDATLTLTLGEGLEPITATADYSALVGGNRGLITFNFAEGVDITGMTSLTFGITAADETHGKGFGYTCYKSQVESGAAKATLSGDTATFDDWHMATRLNVTKTPEPATATLSLLALAGLASRRRRH